MLFLKEEAKKIARVQFTTEERETLITFYHSNPPLWDHGLTEYRDRNIRRVLIQTLDKPDDATPPPKKIKSVLQVYLVSMSANM